MFAVPRNDFLIFMIHSIELVLVRFSKNPLSPQQFSVLNNLQCLSCTIWMDGTSPKSYEQARAIPVCFTVVPNFMLSAYDKISQNHTVVLIHVVSF